MSNSTSSRRKKTDPHILDLTFEEDDPEMSLSSSDEESGQPREGCYQCQPQVSSNPDSSEFDDSIALENMRKKCKQELKKAKNKKEKMKLDQELRMSY